jgi:ribonuclease BN (tRNA processing enzyme)
MRVTILGGSGASPNAGAGCSGYLVEIGGTRLLTDPGPGTLQELRRHADHRSLAAVLVSHLHLDHCLDLFALQVALAYNPIPPPAPVPVWLPPGGAAWLAGAWAAFGDYGEAPGFFVRTTSVREFAPDRALTIGEAVVHFTPTVHNVPCWAMRFGDRHGTIGADLGYTADTGPTAGLEYFFAGVRVLLAEATLLDPGPRPPAERGSLTAREAGALASATGAEALVLTHFWEERGSDAAHAQAAEAFAGRVEFARPGLSIDW